MNQKKLSALHDQDLEEICQGRPRLDQIMLAILKSLHRIEHQLNEARASRDA